MNGVISILKPPGMTSHDVVSYIRKVTGFKKIGHTGTLDPGAAGVLPICLGKSTKIVDYIMNDRKTYICEVTLGNRTDTYDKYGKFLYENNRSISNIGLNDVVKALEAFKGEITQIPPAYSAIKIDGKRAYDLAREGKEVEIPKREVTIYNIRILDCDLPRFILEIECLKGTYIRSICNDIGEVLKCGAYMSFLIRTKTGCFNVKNSFLLEQLDKTNIEGFMISPDKILNYKSVYIDNKYYSQVMNGNEMRYKDENLQENELVKVYVKPDIFIGIGRIINQSVKIEKMLV
jgi:tRNA pseudouridine55 synthase